MIVVRFLSNSPPYMSGEVAGFDDPVAEKLIRAGAAERYAEPVGEVVGDGAGEPLPDLPESAYTPDAQPLEAPKRRGRPPKDTQD